ncbi:hypothetical protein Q5P01_006968 [Channa striata]|uniref:G-protein coupled receptors family 1 profile domain-containing protein n=1 Tax=Channa striata TaxID=64152 RepID=A0AA88N9V1_CHASR|nr:hypothetical protein Q5P01_006968 [Channa striata]
MNHTANQPSGAGTDPMKFTAACVILGLSFLIGAPGNLLVIWTILRYVKKRSHTVVLILHLAVADLLVLITLPLWIYFLAQSLVVGPVFCKILVYIIRACMFSSIYIVTLISVERFLAICYPFGRMHWKTKNSMKTCLAVLWLLALLMGVPYTLTRKAEDKTRPCFSLEVTCVFQKIFLCLEILMGFIVPFIILSICYCQVLAKLKKMSFNTKQKSMVLIHAVELTRKSGGV